MKFFKITFAASLMLSLAAFSIQAQTRILPLGDSVTSSISPHSSYRYWLWKSLVNNHYNVDFVGTQSGVADGPAGHQDFDQDHEGHPGWTTQDALDFIDGIMDATQPNIVLLDLGSNDIADGMKIADVRANLELILQHIHAANPKTRIVVAMPSPYRGPNSARMKYLGDESIKHMVERAQKAGIKASTVNLFDGFSVSKFTFDGVHPNDAGEKFISSKFFSKLKTMIAK